MVKRTKPHRLPESAYRGQKTVSFTACIDQRRRPFVRVEEDYHDHIVRDSEDLGNHVRYLLENPVRAGLVEEWGEYPFSGSLGVDLGEYLRDVEEMRRFR